MARIAINNETIDENEDEEIDDKIKYPQHDHSQRNVF